MLWGELFTEKDRIFLRQHLQEGSVYFGAKQPDGVENRWISTRFAGRWPEIDPK